MSIATKNGSIIVKNGSVAENCGCCGCDPGKAYSIWQSLQGKSVTMTVTGQLPKRDAASWSQSAYATGYKYTSGEPEYQGWWVVNGVLRGPNLQDALTSDPQPPLQFAGVGGGTHHISYSPPYTFGQKQLSLDANPASTAWSSQGSSSAGTVRYVHDDGRCEYSVTLTIRSSSTAATANESLVQGCSMSASYSLKTRFQSVLDMAYPGTRYPVSVQESPDPGWQYGRDMGFATVSPDYYERSVGTVGYSDMTAKHLVVGATTYSYTGWWSSSQKPSSVEWQTSLDSAASGDFSFDQSGNMYSSAQATIFSNFGQWQQNPTPNDGRWVTGFTFNGGYLWNTGSGFYGPYMHVASYSPSSQRYAVALAGGSTVPLSVGCLIA